MHEDKKIETMNIQYNSLPQCTVKFLHWVIQVIVNYFALNLALTYSLNFFIITKRISDWHHFCKWKFLQSILEVTVSVGNMQLTLSIAILQVPRLLQLCRFWGSIAVMLVVHSATIMLVDLFVAITQVTVSVPIMQLEVSAVFIQVKASTANMWVTIFIEIMQVRISVAIMHVVFSAMHYVHDYFYCNYTGDCFCCTYICNSFK